MDSTGTTDADVSVRAVFHGTDDIVIERERNIHFNLSEYRHKGEWCRDSDSVCQALADCEREFNPENYPISVSHSHPA